MTAETYARNISSWIEVEPPADNDTEGCRDWFQTTNQSRTEWRVCLSNGQICAEMFDPIVVRRGRPVCAPPFPLFEPMGPRWKPKETYDFRSIHVSDGWIVGYYRGEFGGKLYWYSSDGFDIYKISNHNALQFFYWQGNLHAVEGCDHMATFQGSLLRLEKNKDDSGWAAITVLDLGGAPYLVAERKSGSLLITLGLSVVEVKQNIVCRTILDMSKSVCGWSRLYPNNSVLSADDQSLYIGMRRFVAELDIQSGALRYLVPSFVT